MSDLRALDRQRGLSLSTDLPQQLQTIKTPLRIEAWALNLQDHPDKDYTHYILQGIQYGFRMGFNRAIRCKATARNLRSAYDHPKVVETYLTNEVKLGRVTLFPWEIASHIPNLTTSPVGVIPKRNRPDKWRLIVDLSSPEGRSVNDGIDREVCSISYASIDDAVSLLQSSGTGAQMAKIDLKEAYRMVPIHPEDRPLLGMRWKGGVFIDGTLPFGLRSVPKIFSAIADALIWVLHKKGFPSSLHYLDDFLLVGPAGTPVCAEALQAMLQLCEVLGVPVAEEKTEGPAKVITFLGIEVDSGHMQLRLPQDKLENLRSCIEQ